jgi:myo-inositol-1(or 4)-monophosphatase
VSDADGKERMLDSGSIVAGNEAIHRKLLKLLKDAGAPSA